MKKIIKRILISFMCGALFFGVVYGYLYYNLNKKILNADEKNFETEYRYLPDSEGIGFLLPDSSAILVYLNFKENCINVVNIEVYDKNNDVYHGYTMDYTVEVDEQLIGGIVDRVGGVNVSVGGETYRYTGSQVEELIKTVPNGSVKSQIISEIFKQISKNGFTRENFVYILQNAKTNLSILDCINWLGFIDQIRKNIVFVE
ncbi:MAG: hypothetical protein IKT42_06740 [Clostridia bacterium]|nr:hypothetical protein [Clostridia bacterium]